MMQRHPNLAILLGWICSVVLFLTAVFTSPDGDASTTLPAPGSSDSFSTLTLVLLLLSLLVVLLVDGWALKAKERSLGWLLLSFVPFVGGLLPMAMSGRNAVSDNTGRAFSIGPVQEPRTSGASDDLQPCPSVWTDVCPVCHASPLQLRKRGVFLGMGTRTYYRCSVCGAVFVPRHTRFVLHQVKDTSNAVWQDYHGQALREEEWQRIAGGGMSDARQHDHDMTAWLTALVDGRLRLPRTPHSEDIVLGKDEEVCFRVENMRLLEPRSVRYSVGGHAGTSIHIAKGLSWRVGAFGARSTSQDEIQTVDSGVLTLTTRRLVFLGAKRSATLELRKIVAMEPYSDGICVVTGTRQRPQYFVGLGPESIFVNITVENRTYREPLNGPMVQCMIEALIHEQDA